MWITFFLPVCVVCVVKVVISFVVIENSTVGNVVVSFVVGEDSNDKDSLVDDADVDSCVDLSVIYYDKLKDVVNRFFSLFQSFFFKFNIQFHIKVEMYYLFLRQKRRQFVLTHLFKNTSRKWYSYQTFTLYDNCTYFSLSVTICRYQSKFYL